MEIKLLHIPEPCFKGCHVLYPSWGQRFHLGTFFYVSAFAKWLSPCNDFSSIIWQESSCWNPGIFRHNWPCIQPNITWRVLSSRKGQKSVLCSTRKGDWKPLLSKVIPVIQFSSCDLRLQTHPSPFLWALGMGGDGQDRQMESWCRNYLELPVWAQND